MTDWAIQDFYPDDVSHCYGCGRLNPHGHQLKTRWDGDETVSIFEPWPEHTAIPGFVYGGLIASLIDCHGTGTAAAAAYREAGREPDTEPPFRYVTASLNVRYLRPTPMGVPLEVRGVQGTEGGGGGNRHRGGSDLRHRRSGCGTDAREHGSEGLNGQGRRHTKRRSPLDHSSRSCRILSSSSSRRKGLVSSGRFLPSIVRASSRL